MNRELFIYFLDKFNDNFIFNILSNNTLNLNIIEEFIDKLGNVYNLSSNPNLTFEFVQTHLDKNWNWYLISQHSNITWNRIQQYPEFSLELERNISKSKYYYRYNKTKFK